MQISYSKDKKQDGVYNIRVIGKNAAEFSGQTVTVSTANGSSKSEILGKCFWSGQDNDGTEVALYAKAGGNAPQAVSNGNAALEKRVAALEAQVRSLLAIMQTSAPSNPLQEDLPF